MGIIFKWRSFFRFIKRKKFDDELVESSLVKFFIWVKGVSGVELGCCLGSEFFFSEKKKVFKVFSIFVLFSLVLVFGFIKCVKKSK